MTSGSSSGGSASGLQAVIPNSFIIENFNPEITTWRRWLQRLQGAFTIFRISGNARVPYFLHYVGPSAFDILCDRLDPKDPFAQSYETVTTKLQEFYDPTPLEIAENFKFHQRRQAEGETMQQFASALHKLSLHCKFGDYLKTALRNQLVFGLSRKKIQTRLLEKRELTYKEALQIATTMELSEQGATSLQNGGTAGPAAAAVEYKRARSHRRKQAIRIITL